MSAGRFYSCIGERIRSLRVREGKTQSELAQLVGVTRSSIANIERGNQRFMAHTLVEIADALAISPEDLFPSTEEHVVIDNLDEILDSSGLTPSEKRFVKRNVAS